MKCVRKIRLSFFLLLLMFIVASCKAKEPASSVAFAKSLGNGWNLGNSFDSYSLDADKGAETWGNPPVTQALLKAIKEQGFDSIRMPLTIDYRVDDKGTIEDDYLASYTQAVDWALAEGLTVIINLHHDAKTWLSDWDGQTSSWQYQRFCVLWQQLSNQFGEYSNKVAFESINEPFFHGVDQATQETYLATLNQGFYQTVRESTRKNRERMLLLPTLLGQTEQTQLTILLKEIQALNDPAVLATVHYYGEWPFSNNLGVVSFNETMGTLPSQRVASEAVIQRLEETFIANQIGVVIGEYGLLGYDRSDSANNIGETVKFINQLNQLTRDQPIALFLWDNGQHFNRTNFEWNQPLFGEIVQRSMTQNSSTGEEINQSFVYSMDEIWELPIDFQGNQVQEVWFNQQLLTESEQYEISEAGVNINLAVLKKDGRLAEMSNGQLGQLKLSFTQGASWIQDLYLLTGEPELDASDTSIGKPLQITGSFHGHQLRRARLIDQRQQSVTENQSWPYLTNESEILFDSDASYLELTASLTSRLSEGNYTLVIDWLDNTTSNYRLEVIGQIVNGDI